MMTLLLSHKTIIMFITCFTTPNALGSGLMGSSSHLKIYKDSHKIVPSGEYILCNSVTLEFMECLIQCIQTIRCAAVNYNSEEFNCQCLSEDGVTKISVNNKAGWKYGEIIQIASTTGRFRLVGGKSLGSGRPEYKLETPWPSGAVVPGYDFDTPGPWGTICDHSFSEGAACWICTHSGFSSNNRSSYARGTHLDEVFESYPIAIRGLNCNCNKCSKYGNSFCGHDYDMYLYCE